MGDDQIQIRRAGPADEAGVLCLLQAALGWGDDERFVEFFAWKHTQGAFGPSPAWVAVHDDRIVGYRAFMRWGLTINGAEVPAVRAVDTATHPDFQRRGIFSRLTTTALADLTAAGVELVFNTPNERSYPGYRKLGWQDVGRLGVGAVPRARALPGLVAGRLARKPSQGADKWSLPTSAGVPAATLLADHDGVSRLLASQAVRPGQLRTQRTPQYLAWRYRLESLAYRGFMAGNSAADGFVILRRRRRGAATEIAVCEVLVPGAVPRSARRLVRAALRQVEGDYALSLVPCASAPGDAMSGARALAAGLGSGFIPLAGQGPRLVCRPLAASEVPKLADWALALGDAELF
ncbi:MAG: GNAT family N-acetyltransferase [Acidimicrobiales bacterium]